MTPCNIVNCNISGKSIIKVTITVINNMKLIDWGVRGKLRHFDFIVCCEDIFFRFVVDGTLLLLVLFIWFNFLLDDEGILIPATKE